MTERSLLILGARSDIANSVAHRFGKAGYDLQLAARNVSSLASHKTDLELRYKVNVTLHEFDALKMQFHNKLLDELPYLPTIAICAVGHLGEQGDCELDHTSAKRVMRSNFEGPASILAILANKFEDRGSGYLIGISSVAGERGRAANYVYGSAKAGFTAFLSGLRNRLAQKGVYVITVLPGFVHTKMTLGMNLNPKLTAEPDEVAQAIFMAVMRNRNVVYVKPIWRLIMMIIRNIPENVFKKLSI